MTSAAAPGGLALPAPVGREFAGTSGYPAVATSGPQDGFPRSACAALARVLASRLRPPTCALASKTSSVLYFTNAASAVKEGFHRLRRGNPINAPERAQISQQLASVALTTPGVVGTFYVDQSGHVAYRHVSPKAKTVFGLDPGMATALAHEINQPLAANAAYLRVARPDKTLLGLHDVIREAASEERERTGVRIELRCEAPRDQIVADRTHLRRAVANLIRTATEAMQSAARRELLISTANPGDDTIFVHVIDSGCGLPESSTVAFFEPFKTAKARRMGVGLSISRSIIEAHYGRIRATPDNVGGAVFSFSLPLEDSGVGA
ncbi:sensor histidine kinase [Methylocystis sp. JAN1]|uniref:sensor histidine kinase n=1 Tax=Methylocystis sp. JAN1 TaxID=3397211 RepID=UPI003FA24D0F